MMSQDNDAKALDLQWLAAIVNGFVYAGDRLNAVVETVAALRKEPVLAARLLGLAQPHVAGFCPMGCGADTLAITGPNGVIVCTALECPGRVAVAQILNDSETEHIVEFKLREFVIRHPLRERLGDALMDCGLLAHLESIEKQDLPGYASGRWRAHYRDDDHDGEVLRWERL